MLEQAKPQRITPEEDILNILAAAERAEAAARGQPEVPMLSYISSFGIDPSDLDENQLYCLFAARALEPIVREIQLPIATEVRPQNAKVRVEREVERMVEKTRNQEGERAVDIPADSLSLARLSMPEELRHLVASQWLLDEVAPEQFNRMLLSGELMKREWREATHVPVRAFESVKIKELVEEDAPPSIKRPHAYVLLDVSGSMGVGYGSKDTAAKGLALAFLRYAHEQRAQMYARRFGSRVSELESGDNAADLKRVAERILWGDDCGGGTDIHGALTTAVSDITRRGSKTPADILLITDGYSRLGSNPLGNVALHTLRVGSDGPSDSEERDAHEKLKRWSKTYRDIEYDGPSVRGTRNDASEIIAHIHSLAGGYRCANTDDEKLAIAQKLQGVEMLASFLGLEHEARDARKALVGMNRGRPFGTSQEARQKGAGKKHEQFLPDFDFERAIEEEQSEREQRKNGAPPTDQPRIVPIPSGGLLDELTERESLWTWIKRKVQDWLAR